MCGNGKVRYVPDMGHSVQNFESFVCGSCGRVRGRGLLADFHLRDEKGSVEPLCRQCEDFVAQGLESVSEQIRSSGRVIVPGSAAPGMPLPGGPTRPPASRSVPPPALASSQRAASNTETEMLRLKYLAQERFIEGFVRGLEASGLDRKRLSVELANTLNSLLRLKQAFVDERIRITRVGCRPGRAQVRKLLRHLDESELTVEAYVRFISEEVAVAKPGRDSPRPSRPST